MFVAFSILVVLSQGIPSSASGCPPPDIIAPCTCSDYTGLKLVCYSINTEEQLRSIFHNPGFPVTDFEEISITYGGFESLGEDLFGQLGASRVNIENNGNLRSLDVKLFQGHMSDLARWISISNNPLLRDADLRLSETLHQETISFTMRANGATTIVPPTGTVNVTDLNVAQNNLTEINRDMFQNMKGLKYLYLYNSGIRTIKPETFADLPILKELQMHGNELGPILPPGALQTHSTGSFTLDNNNIETILPGAIAGFAPSAYISLWSNRLNSFPEETFRPILEELLKDGGTLSLYYNFGLPCDCSIVWLFLSPELLGPLENYYCGDASTSIMDIDSAALIEECQ